jgi:AraC family transcriptional regulator of adaptative response / DNA-3-methyladenine glycosylase II
MPKHASKPPDDGLYLALKTRDARFDGHFFTGVTSTGIYCRPVCKVRSPKRENCRFFTLAAQAELAGFRPCLRCRPELAPGAGWNLSRIEPTGPAWSTQDASTILALQAAAILDGSTIDGNAYPSAQALATKLGVSERHLRRIFEAHWGVTPLQYIQTRRLLAAKQWLTDTNLPVTQVAALSGFASLRRFNAAFIAHYRLQPTALRKAIPARVTGPNGPAGQRLKASYRPPYDVPAMLEFFSKRCVPGIEQVDLAKRTYTRTLALTQRTNHSATTKGRNPPDPAAGWIQLHFPDSACVVEITISDTLCFALPTVLARVRALLDLDADPQAINDCVGSHFAGCDGLRVPGTIDGFELAVRAILGQQITVVAARTMAERLVQRFGGAISTPFEGLNRLFPTAQTLAQASAESLGELSIVRQRQQAILGVARAVMEGHVQLQPGSNVESTLAALQSLTGIGPWTAHYIAMRALRWPDAFVAGDVALQTALGVRNSKAPARQAELASANWRPWRSYAVIRAWHSLGTTAG